ncbi:MAG: hypothetical protein SF028_08950 [Candidatus Sumerlaeia bacterium]|nr:hypothetical protein [Candidatus Sumerlaeia bacterium]
MSRDQKLPMLVAGVSAAVVIAGAAIWTVRSGDRDAAPAPTDARAAAAPARTRAPEPTPEPTPAKATPAPEPTLAPQQSDQLPAYMLPRKEGEKVSLENADLYMIADIDALLEQYGSAGALYRALSPERREQFVAGLWAENRLRAVVAELLDAEPDSTKRGHILVQVQPTNLNQPFDADGNFTKDKELVELLKRTAPLATSQEEILARLRIGAMASDEYGVEYARQLAAAHPADSPLHLAALAQELKSGIREGSFDEAARAAAARRIAEALTPERAAATPLDVRLDTYYSVSFGLSGAEAQDFYRRQLEVERDAQGREILTQLIEAAGR